MNGEMTIRKLKKTVFRQAWNKAKPVKGAEAGEAKPEEFIVPNPMSAKGGKETIELDDLTLYARSAENELNDVKEWQTDEPLDDDAVASEVFAELLKV